MNRRAQNGKRQQQDISKPVSVDDDIDETFHFEADETLAETTNAFRYLTCPRCQNKRLQEVITSGSRLKECPHCRGMWFNLNELEKALGHGLKLTWHKDATPPEIDTVRKPLCPICQTRLVQIKSLEIPDLKVWACTVCQGRWADGVEITKLQKRGLLSSIKEFVMRLF